MAITYTRVLAQRPLGVDVDQVDDGAAALARRCGAAAWERKNGARALAANRSSHMRRRGGADRRRVEGAGVVDQRVEPAEAADGLRDQFRQAVELRQVGLQHQRAARAAAFELRLQRRRLARRVAVVERQVVAGRVQRRAIAAPTRRAAPVTSATGSAVGASAGSCVAASLPHVILPPDPTTMPSMTQTACPSPSADARAHSARLAELIRAQIRAAGGAMPFSRFMELALYAPGLGYYSAGARKFGAAGDFVTAPELGPVFARCVGQRGRAGAARLGADAPSSNSAAAAAPSPRRC